MVRRCIPHIGYLHSGFEKLGEYRQYNQIIPLTDRTDYLIAHGQQRLPGAGGEKLMGIAMHRAVPGAPGHRLRDEPDHLPPGLARHHGHRPRRLHPVPLVVPGAGADLQPAGGVDRRPAHHQPHPGRRPDGRHSGRVREAGLRDFFRTFPKTLDEVDTMFTRNAIWIGRTQGVGALTADEAINYSLSGPMLRASGVDYDVRKDRPYLGYETYDFDVPIGEHGDIYDRYRVRLEEMCQSNRILEQALDRLAGSSGAPINVDDPRVILPPKSRAMSDMEAMIFHFKQVMEGVEAAGGRGLHGSGEPQGRAGLLHRLRRHRQAGALANSPAFVHQPGQPAQACARARSCPT